MSASRDSPSGLAGALMVPVVRVVELVIAGAPKLVAQPVALLVVLVPAGAAGYLYWRWGPWAAGGVVALMVALTSGWRWRFPAGFERWLARRARNGWAALWTYERRWYRVMVLSELSKPAVRKRAEDESVERVVPRVRRVEREAWRDRVLVQMVGGGQRPSDFGEVAEDLAEAFGALSCRVVPDVPGRVWLDFMRDDPLRVPIPAMPIPVVELSPEGAMALLDAVPIGLTETGDDWRVRVRGAHILLGGKTGAGKGSILWSIVRGLAPLIQAGFVEVWASDPKGGMELGIGEGMFTEFTDDDTVGTLRMLERLNAKMDVRTRLLKGDVRKHVPTIQDPHIIVVLDEFASLTAYQAYKQKNLMNTQVGKLLTKGRAPGVSVIAATQDPRAETLKLRELFPDRMAMEVMTRNQAEMLLGEGTVAAGARPHDPRIMSPGVTFVQLEDERTPTRVRAAYPTDADIRQMVRDWGPSSTPGGRLRRMMLGHADGAVPMTEQQRRDLADRMARWEDDAAGLDDAAGERSRSVPA